MMQFELFSGLPTIAIEAGLGVNYLNRREMGGRQLEALALIGLGIHRLSITPASVGPIKELVCQINSAEIRAAMDAWLAAPPPDMRAALIEWAEARGISVD